MSTSFMILKFANFCRSCVTFLIRKVYWYFALMLVYGARDLTLQCNIGNEGLSQNYSSWSQRRIEYPDHRGLEKRCLLNFGTKSYLNSTKPHWFLQVPLQTIEWLPFNNSKISHTARVKHRSKGTINMNFFSTQVHFIVYSLLAR